MNILFISLFIFSLSSSFAQRAVKKSLKFVDGQETTYAEYKKLDLTKFAEISVLAEKDKLSSFLEKRQGMELFI